MTIDDIKALIASDESRTLELKKSTGELKDGMHAACAFLNTDGGWLIFGITPKSLKIVGQEVTDSTKREISQALTGIEPAYDIQPIYVDVPEYPGNKVITFHFEGWKWGDCPYTYRGRPFYKLESTTKIMPRDMYEDRLRAYEPQSFAWETFPAKGVNFSDLNRDRILGCIRLGVEVREALINALCHRQWEKQNQTISIAVYDDRVEIANPGVFPPQIPIENIKESHESYPHNRNMAKALYRSTFLESWGSGIHRIIEACREQGVEDPTWLWDGGFVYVTFKRPTKPDSHSAQVPSKQEGEPLNHRPSTTQARPKYLSLLN